MQAGIVVWIDAAPTIEIDGDGVRLIFRSGGTEFTHRTSRAIFRKACECGMRLLNAEQARETVLHFPMERVG